MAHKTYAQTEDIAGWPTSDSFERPANLVQQLHGGLVQLGEDYTVASLTDVDLNKNKCNAATVRPSKADELNNRICKNPSITKLTKELEEAKLKAKVSRASEELKRKKLLTVIEEEEETNCEAEKAIKKVNMKVKQADVGDEFIHAEKALRTPNLQLKSVSAWSYTPNMPLKKGYASSPKLKGIIDRVVENVLTDD